MRFKRNTTRISRVFYKMTDFRANEIFSVGSFIMLGIDDGWQEKLAHIDRPIAKLVAAGSAGVPPAVAGASRSRARHRELGSTRIGDAGLHRAGRACLERSEGMPGAHRAGRPRYRAFPVSSFQHAVSNSEFRPSRRHPLQPIGLGEGQGAEARRQEDAVPEGGAEHLAF